MMDTIEERVDRGIRLFDEAVPGWEQKIDQPIDVNSNKLCPGGQVFGSYSAAGRGLGIDFIDTPDYAMVCAPSEVDAMNAEWERRIASRREEQREVVEELLKRLEQFLYPRIPTRA